MEYMAPQVQQQATILCCNCGVPIAQNPVAMCLDCIKLSTDITEGIPRESTVHFCRGCDRYLQPPAQWVYAQPESRELLALCLRKLGKLGTVRLIDAGFIWTEPHSRRIKVKLTVQKEAFTSTILQQTFEVEYYVAYQQCRDCAKTYTAHTWQACVQVRQKVSHKRTFLYLEQVIMKHNAHRGCINIKEAKDGVDFYWANRNDAVRFVDFLSSVAPARSKTSEELISKDVKNGTAHYKFTYSVELIPVCRDDLVCLPRPVARAAGNVSPLLLCSKITNTVHLIDPSTLETAEITAPAYWRQPFAQLADVLELVEFQVLDVEILGPTRGKMALADIEVMRSSEMGSTDQSYFARSHLGALLQPGDYVMGYHLTVTNFNDPTFESLPAGSVPDVVLVRKAYPNRRKKNRARTWKLKSLAKEEADMAPRKQDLERRERDYEQFLQDIEEDTEFRQSFNLYKSKNQIKKAAAAAANAAHGGMDVDAMDHDEPDEPDFPEVDISELLDDMEGMNLSNPDAP